MLPPRRRNGYLNWNRFGRPKSHQRGGIDQGMNTKIKTEFMKSKYVRIRTISSPKHPDPGRTFRLIAILRVNR